MNNPNNSSRFPAFIAGVAVGAVVAGAAVFLLKPTGSHSTSPATGGPVVEISADSIPPAELAEARQRIGKLEADNLRLADRIQVLSKEASAPVAAKPTSEQRAPANPLAAMFDGDGGKRGTSPATREMIESAIKQKIEGKLRSLKSRLNLTPEQEASIRRLLAQQLGGRVFAETMENGQAGSDDMAAAAQAGANPAEQIKALLSPEQMRGYDELQQEEIRNNARLVANAEMLQMQGFVGFSQEQQDAVYKALYAVTEADLNHLATDPKRAMDFRGNLDRKLLALKGVLTEEQFKSYEDMQQQQLKLIEEMQSKHSQGITKP